MKRLMFGVSARARSLHRAVIQRSIAAKRAAYNRRVYAAKRALYTRYKALPAGIRYKIRGYTGKGVWRRYR